MLKLEGQWLIWAISLASAVCFSCFGYDQGVFGGLVGSEAFNEQLGYPSPDTISNLGAVYPLGCMVGCIISICFGVPIGRKRSIMFGCCWVTVGGAIQAASFGTGQLYAGRVIAGVGTGLVSSAIPIWLSECTRAGSRGRHIAVQLAVVVSGTVTAYWLDYGMLRNYPGTDVSWRFPLAFQSFYSIVGFFLVMFLPESPRLLYAKNRHADADKILTRLLACTTEDEKFLEQRQAILDNIAVEDSAESTQSTWRAVLWDKSPVKNSRRFWIVIAMQTLQQMGGINAVAYYEYTILHDSIGLSSNLSSLLAGVAVTMLFVGGLGGIYLIEAWGRRTLLLVGSACTTLTMMALTICLRYALTNEQAGWAAYAFIIAYQVAFGIAWLPVPWIYAPEISPLRYRHINASAAVCAEWLFTFVTVRILPVGIANIGWRLYIVWTVFNACQFIFTWFFVVETRGKTLEEIDYQFAGLPVPDSSSEKREVSHLEAHREKASPPSSTTPTNL